MMGAEQSNNKSAVFNLTIVRVNSDPLHGVVDIYIKGSTGNRQHVW
uniref:Uncharacterized protein n=1 Tax=Anguilla anguilla TaxID=7936 RepID=A0A0E9R6K2_ANGAN